MNLHEFDYLDSFFLPIITQKQTKAVRVTDKKLIFSMTSNLNILKRLKGLKF